MNTIVRLVAILLVSALASTLKAAEPIRPDIVVFISDDLGWDDCSIYNKQSGIRTPNMERVARDGMTFTHAFVPSPSCAPARAALLTGLNPVRNGAMFNHTMPRPVHKRWPAWFRELGYETVAIGKVAHYATVTQYGFDHASHFKYHEDTCIAAAVEWLKNRKSRRPLCLFVGSNWPHVPWPKETDYKPGEIPTPPTQVDTPESREFRARYAAAVSNADRDLGLIYDAARQHLGSNTLFLFTSDHGEQFPFGKWNLYDAGIRAALVAVWPGRIQAGTRTDAMVTWTDILPTCVEAAGEKPPLSGPKSGELDGRSFVPVLLGKSNSLRDRIYTTHSGDGRMNEYPMRSVRTRDFKYIRNLAPQTEFHSHVDKAQREDGEGYWASWPEKAKTDAKAAAIVQRYFKRPAEELYDLTSDPYEMTNLVSSTAQSATLAKLRNDLDNWMRDNGDKGLATEAETKPK